MKKGFKYDQEILKETRDWLWKRELQKDFKSEQGILMETQDWLWKIEIQKDQTIYHSLE